MGWTFYSHIVSPHLAVELRSLRSSQIFKVNVQRLKPYIQGIEHNANVESNDLMDPIYFA
jgi:hypothetical protein